jgi:tRNA pseudouridine13 synthase
MSPLSDEALRFDFDRYPYLTEALAPVTGVIRREPADFRVDEVPAAPPAGEGPHLLVHIEKTDLTTRRVVEHLMAHLGLKEDDIGWAGLKDRRAITAQWLSIPAASEPGLETLPSLPGLVLGERAFHGQKLQEGYLAGNRFRILLRDVEGTAEQARATLAALAARGVPNYFGPQRFGRMGDNAVRGYKLVKSGRWNRKKWLDKFLVNSLQSLIFNDWLALRLERGLFDRVIHGDVAEKVATHGKFLVGEPDVEQPRALAFEISPTGPLFGKKYHEAQFEARALEDEVLARYELGRGEFGGTPGSRRAIRIPLADWAVEEASEGLWLSFFLPRGAYATAVLRELMKANPETPAVDLGLEPAAERGPQAGDPA